MKRIIIGIVFVLALLSFGNASAQVGSSMQFSQVIIKTWDGTSPTYTVPAGKIWKVEGSIGSVGVAIWTVNGSNIFGDIHTGGSTNYAENLPLWFPENTTLVFYENGATSLVSIIEFTVIP